MKKVLLLLAALLCVNLSTALAAEAKTGSVVIPEGTVLQLMLLDALDSNVNDEGDAVSFELQNDVIANNITVIPKAAKLRGTIRKAHGSRIFNQSAVIRIKLEDFVLPNGKAIAFKRDVKVKGGVNYANMAVGTAMGFVVPFSGMFFKGREIDCRSGTIIEYELKDPIDLGMSQMELVQMKSRQRAQREAAAK